MSLPIPIIDLFAGPGGLGEGFSPHPKDEQRPFRIALSIEMETSAHRTLTLRAFYRWFLHENKEVPSAYYEYLKAPNEERDRVALFEQYPDAARAAEKEAQKLTLGETQPEEVDRLINRALNRKANWILIGGPPCQAYSLAGRSKIVGTKTNKILRQENLEGLTEEAIQEKREWARRQAVEVFALDKRHTLYREYLRIIAKHAPTLFVMENVRGILSSRQNGERIFPRILSDLRHPYGVAHEYWPQKQFLDNHYRIFSFVTGGEPTKKIEEDFLIHAEDYGVPQTRHRVILLGLRSDIAKNLRDGPLPCLADVEPYPRVSVRDVLHELPKLRSGLSKNGDSLKQWQSAIRTVEHAKWIKKLDPRLRLQIQDALSRVLESDLPRMNDKSGIYLSKMRLRRWYLDSDLTCLPNHETRSHMLTDLHRYLFAAAFGRENKRSPNLADFPAQLLPEHKNIDRSNVSSSTFSDRFRVQIWDNPSSTITSHISKDGHYFIHPDPAQCRSLTVREAARLQTFPDNYLFEGGRTQQYHQVGNAVPPLLAKSLANVVHQILSKSLALK